jgi:hypothetical protein
MGLLLGCHDNVNAVSRNSAQGNGSACAVEIGTEREHQMSDF